MNTVTVGGVTYTKLSVLAKKYNYTTDYIGQLCRANKVEAELVGRAWYANELSLQEHKADRYKDSSSNDKETNNTKKKSEEAFINHIPVTPRFSKRTHRHLVDQSVRQQHEKHYVQVAYVADEADLEPKLNKQSTARDISTTSVEPSVMQPTPVITSQIDSHSYSVPVRINHPPAPKKTDKQAESETLVALKVTQNPSPYDLSFTDIPSVYMRGSVKVRDLENEDFIHSPEATSATKSPRKVTPKLPQQTRVPVHKAVGTPDSPASPLTGQATPPKKTIPNNKMKFSPSSVANPTPRASLILPVGFVVALLGGSLLLFTGSTYVVENQMIFSSWNLQLASLRELLTFFEVR